MGTFRVEVEIGDAAGERWETIEALVATSPLLGAYALEGLRLTVDPVGRRLVPVPGLLMEFAA
jgi:hypothetical protein